MRPIDIEEKLFQTVANEIRDGLISEGLMLKASVDAGGDVNQARILYTRYRVNQLAGDVGEQAAAIEAEHRKDAKRARLKLLFDYLPFIAIAVFCAIAYLITS